MTGDGARQYMEYSALDRRGRIPAFDTEARASVFLCSEAVRKAAVPRRRNARRV